MGRLKRLSGEDIVKTLRRMGFESVRQRGSHVVMKKITVDGIHCRVRGTHASGSSDWHTSPYPQASPRNPGSVRRTPLKIDLPRAR
ncbi:MAG: type II toxin-antitoxin system HicA family toxin [Chitinispirillaceae bacterium]|nr:type II toxin-antitoxin system HicA family toxin [Chitinispirillaceae bacterium]